MAKTSNTLMMGQFYPTDSVLHKLDARAKICALFLLLAAAIGAHSPWQYLLVTACIAALILLSHLPMQAIFSTLRRLGWFFLLIFLMNALFFSASDPYFTWWIFMPGKEGIVQGFNVCAHVALAVLLSTLLTCTTAPMQITGALQQLLRPLRFIGVPVENVAMILSLALSFIPTLAQEAETIKKAQIARGARFESKNIFQKATSLLPLVLPIFLCAFRRADDLSIAMEARGYRDAKHRTKKKPLPLQKRDVAAVLFSIVICAGVFTLNLI